MKKFSTLFVIVCLMLSVLTGCNQKRQIEITGGNIESVSMSGMRTVNLGMMVSINNPYGKLEIREADGVLMHFGKVIGKMTLDPFVVNRKTEEEYHVKANFTLEETMGLRQIMQFMNVNVLNECTVDIHVKARLGGVQVRKRYKDIPMKELFER